jgi:hypothetical protein
MKSVFGKVSDGGTNISYRIVDLWSHVQKNSHLIFLWGSWRKCDTKIMGFEL